MNDFEGVLESCLTDIRRGASTLDECLARNPQHAEQLKPLLKAAGRLERTGQVRPSAAFKARARAKLTGHMQAHPRVKRRGISMFQKLAISFAALICTFMIAGTAYAQGVLPGNSFYTWKLASEDVWRAVSLDPVYTDIQFLSRRTNEWIAVANDPHLKDKALKRYQEAENKLKSSANENADTRILPALEENQKLLKESGISFPINLKIPGPNDESGGRQLSATPALIAPISTVVP